MPKIPTFEARGRPTTDAPGVTTGIQISPTATPAAGLLPQLNTLTNYAIKKRDIAEKVQANKKVFEIKGELDKYLKAEEQNIDDENAINNFKTKYNDYIKQELSLVTNNRVKKRIQQNLDLEYSEYVYNIKKNSYTALEKNALEDVNNNITSYTSKYSTTQDVQLKSKYRTEAQNKIKQFAEDFDLPKNVLDKKLEALDRDFLLADMQQFAGNINGVDAIKFADNAYGGEKVLNNDDFGKGVFDGYKQKISELTVKGDPNSDYDRAIELINELKNFERDNGYKVKTGDISVDIDNLEQQILTEEIEHENLIKKQGDNKQFNDFANDSKISLLKTITDQKLGLPATIEDLRMADEIDAEFEQMKRDYVDANPEATLENKKSFIRNLTSTLNNIYQDRKISKIKSRSFTEDTFDIVAEKNRVLEDAKLLTQGELDQLTIQRYEKVAKANGYITTVTRNGKKTKIGDIGAFLNDYIPILKRQVTATQVAE